MAKLRPKQLEPSRTGPSKLGFDGEEDGWLFVKKQRVIIVLPALPLPEHFTLEKPETSLPQAELRDGIVVMQEIIASQTVVPSLPLSEHFTLQKAATSQSQAEFGNFIADAHHNAPLHSVVPSLPLPEHIILQKPATSQPLADLRDGIVQTEKPAPVHTMVPSLPVTEHYTFQKPPTLQSQSELRVDMHKKFPLNTVMSSLPLPEHLILQKPATSHSQADLRADKLVTTLVHTMVPSLPLAEHCNLQKPATSHLQAELHGIPHVVPSLPLTEHCTLQKSATSQSQPELRDFVAGTHETTHFHAFETEACPDFTAVDKPEIVMGCNFTTRKAPVRKRSLQDSRMDADRGVEIDKSRKGRKPIRFPRVMCSSVVMDNEKLRVLNLERKVEKAGGLNEWVGSIGLGREFERMLRGQRMNKFQVANLTMEKLKHMGALAVGPRRKLIHAIRCVYDPHCLGASFS